MSKEKRHKQKHENDTKSKNGSENEQPQNLLFNSTDLKSYEMYGDTQYTSMPQAAQALAGKTIPTGVADIDETVKLPTVRSNSARQRQTKKPVKFLKPSENLNNKRDHLPPINNKTHRDSINHEHGSLHQHHKHHHHHHHHHNHDDEHKRHHHHHHHTHDVEMETYDPRWWYLPPNSVHAPRPWKPPQYHFVAPKWYESTNTQNRPLLGDHKLSMSPRKYVDCRCEVCKPSRQTPHGVKWILNE